MAYREGSDGTVYIGNVLFEINNWSINFSPNVADVTPIGSSGPKNTYTGFIATGGTMTAAYQSTAPFSTLEDLMETGSTLTASMAKFVEATASMWFGNVVFTNMSKTQDAPGVQQFSADWVISNGRLTHSTSTST